MAKPIAVSAASNANAQRIPEMKASRTISVSASA